MANRTRSLSDFTTARANLYDSFRQAATEIKPVETPTHVLELADVDYDAADDEDATPEKYNFSAQTDAIYNRQTLGRRLRGTWNLRNKETNEVDSTARGLLAIVPRVNEDGTMIYRGSRYAMVNQHRIKPAAFARRKKNEETESFFNVKPGTGSNHRYVLNPETGIYSMSLGHSSLPLAGVLRVLGVTDDQMRETWGKDMAETNFRKTDPKLLAKLYERLVPKKEQVPGAEDDYKRLAVKQAFSRMRVDPWSMRRTVGVETDRVDGGTILAATKRVLELARGDKDGDDRDHLAYQTFHSVEDTIPERVRLDKDGWQKKYLMRAARRGDVSKIPTKLLQKQIQAAIFSSGLGVQPDYANPLDALDRATRVSKKGEGGLQDSHSTPTESRDVHASQHLFIDPARTVESLSVGIDTNATMDTHRGEDGKLYVNLLDAKTGQKRMVNPEDVVDATVAIGRPGREVDGYVGAVRNGREEFVRPEEVDFYAEQPGTQLFSDVANLVPFRSAMAPHRLAMGSRFLAQALPVVNREAPLVQSGIPGTDSSFEKKYGKTLGAVDSPVDGFVKDIQGDRIIIKTHEGDKTVPMYRMQPLGGKTGLYNTPVVKVGDRVKPGQLLAKSNFTDDKGVSALGLNARIAFMPWMDNYEDAFSISESFAKRMSSEHLYRSRYDADPEHRTSKNQFLGAFPSAYSRDQLGKLDDEGVVKIGQRVSEGDPLILAAQPKGGGKGRVHKKGGASFRDQTMTWDHHVEGVVADVRVDRKGNKTVAVKAVSPMQSGDKMSDLFGAKGVVHVIPDEQMPTDESGKPFEIVASDLGLISRENPGRAHAAFLGKVARKRGEAYRIEEFPEEGFDEFIRREAKKNGVSTDETIIDPRTGRKVPGVGTGELYMLKLHHLSETKSHARGVGSYSSDGTPAKGSAEGAQAKRLSNQELGALVSHGAYEFIREGALVRGQQNDEYWARYINGVEPEQPKVPFVYEKFIGYLKGMGINPVESGTKTKIMLMTDKDTKELASRGVLKNGETLDFNRDNREISGGLMDPSIFGGEGEKWGRYELSEPIPHPMMEDTIRRLLNVTKKDYREVVAGRKEVGDFGKGPKGIQGFLENLDLNKEIALTRKATKDARKTKREDAVVRLRYLKGLAERDIKPSDLLVSQVPILPPKMRPISVLQNSSTPLIDGMNLLYRDMISADQSFKKVSQFSEDASNERLAVYDGVRAAYGLGQPLDPELRSKKVTGLMKRMVGTSPKYGYVQRKLLSGTVDSVGRGVALPNAKLSLDQVGIPESQAWTMYKMPVVREMRRRGIPLSKAMQDVNAKTPLAREILESQMSERPVVVSRAPVLHKYGILAFTPKITPGDTIQLNPLIHGGLGLDHDGDTLNFHAILGDEAAKEAKEKMMPSRALLSPRDFKSAVHKPGQDHALGLYLASQGNSDKVKQRAKIFRSSDEVRKAFSRGEIDASTNVIVLDKQK